MFAATASPFVHHLGDSAGKESVHPMAIQIPAPAMDYTSFRQQDDQDDDMKTPPLEPSSPCSSIASSPRFDSFLESIAAERRRRSREFFFPSMPVVESAAPVVTRASDLTLEADHHFSWADHQRHRLRQFFFPSMHTIESAAPVVTRAADLSLSVADEQKQVQPASTQSAAARPAPRNTRHFFPNLESFESAVPVVTRAADLNLADHRHSWGEHHRRRTRERFFPSLGHFESAVPTVTRASEVKLSTTSKTSGQKTVVVQGATAAAVVTTTIQNKGGHDTEHRRRASQEFFFPNQKTFESAVPVVTRASEVDLGHEHRQHWQKQTEIAQQYHADSLMTADGRRMFRLL